MKNLGAMILSEKQATFDFPGYEGLRFTLAYQSKEEIQALLKKCTSSVFKRGSTFPVEETDNELFTKLFSEKVLKGWEGLKFSYLVDFVPLDESQVEDMEDTLGYSSENAAFLLKNSTLLDNWVGDKLADVGNFKSSK